MKGQSNTRQPISSDDRSLIRLTGVVERITFHNPENGWSVIKVTPFSEPHKHVTVVIYQAKVFAGSSMEFWGMWVHHPKHGEQFKAERVFEKKPATSAAVEKYLGSGLIKGVGPKTANKIVNFFKDRTLDVFEGNIDELLNVPGIADKKLRDIKNSWREHKAIRDVMIFLQGHGISTLFAVKIYRAYGNAAIDVVSHNPYRLARDIYGIGFFSADRIALNMGFERDGEPRIEAGIKHVLAASREEGHCYLTEEQIVKNTLTLLEAGEGTRIKALLASLLHANDIKQRPLMGENGEPVTAYYANSLFFDEQYVAARISRFLQRAVPIDQPRVRQWVGQYCQKHAIALSEEQQQAIVGITGRVFSILTGGPGCGKTTTTRVLVKLLQAMKKTVVLTAPTGRAAQRMSEVIGQESKTIHRLLEWAPNKNGFKRCEEDPLNLDFLIVDECSMLDINLAAALLKAVPLTAQIVFLGDPDQLPSVGAGNVLSDLLQTRSVSSYRLTKIFRQAAESLIVRFAHQMNQGDIPKIESPLYRPRLWEEKADCLFIDAEEATQDQIQFLQKAKAAIRRTLMTGDETALQVGQKIQGVLRRRDQDTDVESLFIQEIEDITDLQAPVLTIPDKFKHVDLLELHHAQGDIEELKAVIKAVHPWSALHYGMTGLDTVLRLYSKTIPEHYGQGTEIQVLTPQVRGSLGTLSLNQAMQNAINPEREGRKHIVVGNRLYREDDRVIQTRNNYDLGVFNGDIGRITSIDLDNYSCVIQFGKQVQVKFEREDLTDIALAYAITIHKSQGSEFDAVIIPVTAQHYKMLFRNLIYTGLTRAKRLCVFVGSRKALAMSIKQRDNRRRQTALTYLIEHPQTLASLS